jgi:hypothetical protein
MFDGAHYFILERKSDTQVVFRQCETFSGVLVPIVVRNSSRCDYSPVRRLQTRADSGMMIAWCSWRERSSE